MQAIVISELLKITDSTVKTNYRVINLDGQEPILNNRLGFIPSLNQYVHLKLDESDDTGKTLVLDSELFDDKEILIQYTNVIDLRDFKLILSTATHKSILSSKIIELEHEPSNLFGLCPILNFGYALIRSPMHGTSLKVPTGPISDDSIKKSIQLHIPDDVFENLKDNELTVQYIYAHAVDKISEIPVICNDVSEFKNGLITLKSHIGNINDESSFLNFGLASTLIDNRPVEFGVFKFGSNTCGSSFFSESELDTLEGKSIVVQYIKTVKLEDVNIPKNLLDTKSINGFPLKYSELDITPTSDDKFKNIARQFADAESMKISRNGEMVDGVFTVSDN